MTIKTMSTEELLDSLDPEKVESRPMPTELRKVLNAANGIDAAEERLRDAVRGARSNGYSWGRIGMILGISRQAVQQRYGDSP
jgi:hypothetical protein